MSKFVKHLGVLTLIGLVGVAGACSAPGTPDHVRKNFSPELFSTHHSFEETRNISARARDMNKRQLVDDVNRTILRQDRPSRLSPYPVP